MTSRQDSSKTGSIPPSIVDVESLAGWFHPHAIEVQEFSHYALLLDVRSETEFDDDHIPGAVRVAPEIVTGLDSDRLTAGVPAGESAPARLVAPALAPLVDSVRLDEAILVYCGRGGRDCLPLAKALRWTGWTVDVLPGGYTNYRRWVLAGLEALLRCIDVRVVMTALGSEGSRVLKALAAADQQVLDLAACAGWRPGALTRSAGQPSQARFESRLLHALRQLDPRRPVWAADSGRPWGHVSLPGALTEALAQAPTVALACPLAERLACWCEDEPVLQQPEAMLIETVATASPGTPLVAGRSGDSARSHLLACLLADRDEHARLRQAAHTGDVTSMPVLQTHTLAPDGLLQAVRAWLPQVGPGHHG